MTLRERLRTLPADAGWGYCLAVSYLFGLSSLIFTGPEHVIFVSLCLLIPVQVGAICVIFFQMGGERPQVGWRIPSICMLILSLGVPFFFGPHEFIDLNVMRRIDLAGGPKALSDWAQKLIPEHEVEQVQIDYVDGEKIPIRVQTYLSKEVMVIGRQVHIELGGGFFHYGVIVVPRSSVHTTEWWQPLIGWPPEVGIYHEN